LNGMTPDPSAPAQQGDSIARLKLTQALKRAKFAIAWERVWPPLARLHARFMKDHQGTNALP